MAPLTRHRGRHKQRPLGAQEWHAARSDSSGNGGGSGGALSIRHPLRRARYKAELSTQVEDVASERTAPASGARESGQTSDSIARNVSFFSDQGGAYKVHLEKLDTYRFIREGTNQAIAGIGRLIDVGSGGFFDY